MSLSALLTRWRNDPAIAANIAAWETIPARQSKTEPFPADLHAALVQVLRQQHIDSFYSHQSSAWYAIQAGQNLALVSGTASGKSLCYQLPILQALIEQPDTRALCIFPTKALTQDQRTSINHLIQGLPLDPPLPAAAVYDGDTPASTRPGMRSRARILFTNPDMLHLGILPYHTQWADFFANLRYIVLDEIHTYRGVFGSHIANVLRRLQRICRFYGCRPQYILASATIANPSELAERLIGATVTLIEEDGSGRGERNFLIYNPPILDASLGLRRSHIQESLDFASEFIAVGLQTILFCRTRRTVEKALKSQRENPPTTVADVAQAVRGYRSGYLPAERRAIEQGLRLGDVRLVIATTALELGIDIGGMGAAILAGYPGSIAGLRQQAGRAGRGDEEALAVMVASPSPLDQFLTHHPEYCLGRSPEAALINPDHLLILLSHLQCAAYELPFDEDESFGTLPAAELHEMLDYLQSSGILHHANQKYFWRSADYPSQAISLRSASAERIILQDDQNTIGEVDKVSAAWMVHRGAIYLHEAQMYLVQDLDLENNVARLQSIDSEYYTEARMDTRLDLVRTIQQAPVPGGEKYYGELAITSQVTGYQRIHWMTRAVLGNETLDMPPSTHQTTAYWLALSPAAVEKLRTDGLWNSDPNDYGKTWPRQRDLARTRDGYRCQVCGTEENGRAHDVHHRIPFRTFPSAQEANQLNNLVTLCPACHRRVELAVRVRSGLSGLAYLLGHLAPLFLMCDSADLGVHADVHSPLADGVPVVAVYDQVAGGIGFSEKIYEMHTRLIEHADELVAGCGCIDGCPSCIGPGGENGTGGKRETHAILASLSDR
jgi:DEAD/DEAH box helicase domain-containing protein